MSTLKGIKNVNLRDYITFVKDLGFVEMQENSTYSIVSTNDLEFSNAGG